MPGEPEVIYMRIMPPLVELKAARKVLVNPGDHSEAMATMAFDALIGLVEGARIEHEGKIYGEINDAE